MTGDFVHGFSRSDYPRYALHGNVHLLPVLDLESAQSRQQRFGRANSARKRRGEDENRHNNGQRQGQGTKKRSRLLTL